MRRSEQQAETLAPLTNLDAIAMVRHFTISTPDQASSFEQSPQQVSAFLSALMAKFPGQQIDEVAGLAAHITDRMPPAVRAAQQMIREMVQSGKLTQTEHTSAAVAQYIKIDQPQHSARLQVQELYGSRAKVTADIRILQNLQTTMQARAYKGRDQKADLKQVEGAITDSQRIQQSFGTGSIPNAGLGTQLSLTALVTSLKHPANKTELTRLLQNRSTSYDHDQKFLKSTTILETLNVQRAFLNIHNAAEDVGTLKAVFDTATKSFDAQQLTAVNREYQNDACRSVNDHLQAVKVAFDACPKIVQDQLLPKIKVAVQSAVRTINQNSNNYTSFDKSQTIESSLKELIRKMQQASQAPAVQQKNQQYTSWLAAFSKDNQAAAAAAVTPSASHATAYTSGGGGGGGAAVDPIPDEANFTTIVAKTRKTPTTAEITRERTQARAPKSENRSPVTIIGGLGRRRTKASRIADMDRAEPATPTARSPGQGSNG
jgi:hypothetical protein